jgi:hypothetical protein
MYSVGNDGHDVSYNVPTKHKNGKTFLELSSAQLRRAPRPTVPTRLHSRRESSNEHARLQRMNCSSIVVLIRALVRVRYEKVDEPVRLDKGDVGEQ